MQGKVFKNLQYLVHTEGCVFLEARKHHTDAKYCFMCNLVKSEVSDVMDPEENNSEIYRFFVISFALLFLVNNGIFSCVLQIKSLDINVPSKGVSHNTRSHLILFSCLLPNHTNSKYCF